MRGWRIGFVLAGLTVIGLGLVHLRVERRRTVARVLALETEWMRMRSEWWSLQTRAARLRAPQRLRERLRWYDGRLVGPRRLVPPYVPLDLAADRVN